MKYKVNTIAQFLLIIWSAWMVFSGFLAALHTMGPVVSGTLFGMQAAIFQQLAYLVVWVGLFGCWKVARIVEHADLAERFQRITP